MKNIFVSILVLTNFLILVLSIVFTWVFVSSFGLDNGGWILSLLIIIVGVINLISGIIMLKGKKVGCGILSIAAAIVIAVLLFIFVSSGF